MSDPGPLLPLTVTPEEAGQKLLSYLSRRVGRDVPQSLLHRWIRSGQVRVDGRRAKPFQRLTTGQTVRIPPHAAHPGRAVDTDDPEAGRSIPQRPGPHLPPPLPVLSRVGDVLVVNKPAGLPVHGGTGHGGADRELREAHGDSVVARLRAMFPDAPFAPTPAHRLDRDTSGILAVGLSYVALRALQERLSGGDAAKTYLAWAHGCLGPFPDGVLELRDRLIKAGPAGAERMRRAAPDEGHGGVEALAYARSLAHRTLHGRPATLVAVRLVTGRTHQIRVQLAERGHPLLGDRKYGGPPAPGLMLHAWRLTLESGRIECPPPWPAPWAPTPLSA